MGDGGHVRRCRRVAAPGGSGADSGGSIQLLTSQPVLGPGSTEVAPHLQGLSARCAGGPVTRTRSWDHHRHRQRLWTALRLLRAVAVDGGYPYVGVSSCSNGSQSAVPAVAWMGRDPGSRVLFGGQNHNLGPSGPRRVVFVGVGGGQSTRRSPVQSIVSWVSATGAWSGFSPRRRRTVAAQLAPVGRHRVGQATASSTAPVPRFAPWSGTALALGTRLSYGMEDVGAGRTAADGAVNRRSSDGFFVGGWGLGSGVRRCPGGNGCSVVPSVVVGACRRDLGSALNVSVRQTIRPTRSMYCSGILLTTQSMRRRRGGVDLRADRRPARPAACLVRSDLGRLPPHEGLDVVAFTGAPPWF